MAQLVVSKKLNPLDDVAQMLGIKQTVQGLKAQQQTITQNEMNQQQQSQLQAIFKDPANWDQTKGQLTDQALLKVGQIHPQTQAELLTAWQRDPKSLETIKNLQSEEKLRTDQSLNLKSDNDRADQATKDTADRLNASESAGVLIPGSEANVVNPTTKQPARSQQFKVRQADGSYKIETRYTDPLYEKPEVEKNVQNQTVDTAEGVMQYNPKTGRYDIRVGGLKPPASTSTGTPFTPESLPDYTETMKSGRKYVNVSKLTGKDKNALAEAAARAGLPTVDAPGADALANIDTARDNLQKMNDTLAPYLAGGSAGRLYSGPRNTIESMLQMDPNLTSVGTYRNAAIQAMRSVAGAKGLRINQAEIQMAIDNDIPKLTDTAPVAKAKMEQMLGFLDNAEKGLLVKDRSSGGAPPPAAPAAKVPAGVDPAVWAVMTPQERALWK